MPSTRAAHLCRRLVMGLVSARETRTRAQLWLLFLSVLQRAVEARLELLGADPPTNERAAAKRASPVSQVQDEDAMSSTSVSSSAFSSAESGLEEGTTAAPREADARPADQGVEAGLSPRSTRVGAALGALGLCLLRADMAASKRGWGDESLRLLRPRWAETARRQGVPLTAGQLADLWRRSDGGPAVLSLRKEEARQALKSLTGLAPAELWDELDELAPWAALCTMRAGPSARIGAVAEALQRLVGGS